ncbi:splicing factor [Tanacetum coccineum]
MVTRVYMKLLETGCQIQSTGNTRHIYANFTKKFSGMQLQKLFLHAASCTAPQLFYSKMEEMKQINSEAYEYLIGRDPNSWSRRHKPIITMLEDIKVYLMQRVVAMHNIAVNLEDQITPTVRKKLEHWTVFPSAYQLLEVRCGDLAFGVNLGEKTCACRLWQLSGIPCIHVVAGYMHLNKDPDEGVSIRHNKASCDKEPVPKAPILRKPPGRTRQYVFRTHASARGRGRGSRGGRNGSGRVARSGRNGYANRGQQLMDEDEIRENLEHDYMQDLLDAVEDKRVQEDREYQEKLYEEAFQEAMEQQQMNEQIDEERERQNREERE